jgi:hypothetical protein
MRPRDRKFLGGSVADPDPHVFVRYHLDPGLDSSFIVRIRIHILASSSKNCKENLDFYCIVFFMTFYLRRIM